MPSKARGQTAGGSYWGWCCRQWVGPSGCVAGSASSPAGPGSLIGKSSPRLGSHCWWQTCWNFLEEKKPNTPASVFQIPFQMSALAKRGMVGMAMRSRLGPLWLFAAIHRTSVAASITSTVTGAPWPCCARLAFWSICRRTKSSRLNWCRSIC